MFRIYTLVNYAETCRDPDDIRITELGYVSGEEQAIAFMNKYMKENFILYDQMNYEVYKTGNNLRVHETGSWGRLLCADYMNMINEVSPNE